ncbi:helicase-exonuclease AddAB subunit AddB [Lottiidibacillus patelloidae]|uniref:ATP-dependent helicase/deoxyribonuclease subunit B n=1 Tax=Lottiidibacillus patelloidae TaxID=2670334 RepID=A0A263BWV0_9BACI|nr:helicase-exonuclease AddAB subunit AddB [Lottiidibacillus patelloidae]OZM58209.1 helicase-exonuclease AddAB subunit AddB [Lottiidibacillus patelloidae]
MGLRFILGRAGSGKSSTCITEIVETIANEPNGKPIIYLTPEQMTFQSEFAIVNSPNVNGMIRAQVFSFTRLAWKVLQETGGIARDHINSVGIHMMLRKIIEEQKQELKVFKRASDKNGFIDEVEAMVTELKRYCLSADDLLVKKEELLLEHNDESNKTNAMIIDKLHDLHVIYSKFEKKISEKYVDSEDYLRLLAENASNSDYLREADIYIDGFYQFTPQELEVIQALLTSCNNVTITLTLDRPYHDTEPHELDLFHSIATTYKKIRKIAKENSVEIEDVQDLNTLPLQRFEEAPDFTHLEQFWQTRPTVPYEEEPEHISLHAAVNRRAEVENVAREVLQLVRDKNYRFRDIALLVRDVNAYQDIIKTTFSDYEIPVFLDEKKTMLHHPLIEFIRSSIETVTHNWQYDAVFQAAKTNLFFPTVAEETLATYQEDLDRLENFVLANGIKGYRWQENRRWEFAVEQLEDNMKLEISEEKKRQEDRLAEMRQFIVEPLTRFEEKLKKSKNARQMCTEIFELLLDLEVYEKIELWKEQAEEKGKLRTAKEHDQVWDAVIELLDQCVELFGDEPLSKDLFLKMIESGIENMQFSLVPPSLDQVMLGAIDRSRFSNVKCAFVLGVNEGVFPAKPQEDGLFLEEEREALQKFGAELAPGAADQLLHEQFIVYLALTSASDKLWISYPLADEEGKTLLASPIIERVKEVFPRLKEGLLKNEPGEVSEGEQLQFITTPRNALSFLVGQIREWKKGYHLGPLWWDSYNYLINTDWKQDTKRVLSSLFYQNIEKSLSPQTSLELYGTKLKSSVSRMELHQACPFSHFMSYGLKLKEREMFRLDVPDIGRLFHAALKEMNDYLTNHDKSWKDLTPQECNRIAIDVVDMLAPKLQREILLSSNRYGYIKRKLTDVVARASQILSEQARASGFEPAGVELAFGGNGNIPPLEIELSNGVKMEVVGRIDRVDKAESDQGLLLRIVDYKSSKKQLDLAEVYYGLTLQMLTYLDVVISSSKQWLGVEAKPAGVLYFHIHNPFVDSVGKDETEIEKAIFKEFKMKGYVLADQQVARLMDQSFNSKSDIVPVEITSKGEFHKRNSRVASNQDFQLLQDHSRKMIKSIGEEITTGKINISPYQLNKKNPCTFCSYKPVCQFDQGLDENEHRYLKKIDETSVLEKLHSDGRQES